jgi:hypothetical protein
MTGRSSCLSTRSNCYNLIELEEKYGSSAYSRHEYKRVCAPVGWYGRYSKLYPRITGGVICRKILGVSICTIISRVKTRFNRVHNFQKPCAKILSLLALGSN